MTLTMKIVLTLAVIAAAPFFAAFVVIFLIACAVGHLIETLS